MKDDIREFQEMLARSEADHVKRMATDPDYRARMALAEAQAAREEVRRAEQAKCYEQRLTRQRIVSRGVPLKDLERVLDEGLKETTALRAVREFWQRRGVRTLVLSGRPGCGKTTAAAWLIAQDCPDPYRGPSSKGQRADETKPVGWPEERHPRFIRARSLMKFSQYDQAKAQPLEQCSMLVLDDMGMEYADEKGFMMGLLDDLLDARYTNALRTVITTNLSASAFADRYSERLVDRIREGDYLEINEPSLRGRE